MGFSILPCGQDTESSPFVGMGKIEKVVAMCLTDALFVGSLLGVWGGYKWCSRGCAGLRTFPYVALRGCSGCWKTDDLAAEQQILSKNIATLRLSCMLFVVATGHITESYIQKVAS